MSAHAGLERAVAQPHRDDRTPGIAPDRAVDPRHPWRAAERRHDQAGVVGGCAEAAGGVGEAQGGKVVGGVSVTGPIFASGYDTHRLASLRHALARS